MMAKELDVAVQDPGYGIAPAGYRLPAETHVGRVRLQVSDLERSLAWYGRVLGFRVTERRDGFAALAAHGDGAPLVELHEKPGAAPSPMRGQLGLYHFAILLPDRPALGRFVAHLGEAGERFGASDHLVSEATYLHDPDGLGIEVYADRPREEWRAEERELQMTTVALNLRDVMAAAHGEPWTGMPAGTTIGHVHLHVGDLRPAADFYHAALGLDAVVWSYPGALFLSAGGYHHHLGLNTWAGPDAHPAGDADARLLEWELVVPSASDAQAAARSLVDAGFSADGDGRIPDPWGTMVRIIAAS
ncbi:MAG: VOC family protein [Gemmatimonadetes bacterium]|nr:VOC family protein [Gemmatimonadota bacterium]